MYNFIVLSCEIKNKHLSIRKVKGNEGDGYITLALKYNLQFSLANMSIIGITRQPK